MKKWKWRNPLPKETKRDTIEDKHLARKILLYEHEECDQRREEALEERAKEILEIIQLTAGEWDSPLHLRVCDLFIEKIRTKYGL